MYIEERQLVAVRKSAAAVFRQVVGSDTQTFEPHKLEWSELNKHQATILNGARSLLDRAEAASDADQAEFGLAHEGLMSIWDQLDLEKNHRTTVGSRAPRSTGVSPNCPNEDGAARGEHRVGLGDEASKGEVYALKPEQRMAEHKSVRGRGDHYDGLTEGAYMRAMIVGPKTDLERRALSEGTDSAGGYTVPDILSAKIIDRMRANMVCVEASALTIPLTSEKNHIAKVLTDPVPAWREKAQRVGTGDPTFATVSFVPKSLAVLITVSRELLEDSVNIEQALPAILAKAMALEVDRAALFGSGASSQPSGLVHAANIGVVALAATPGNYVPIIKARTLVLSANAPAITAVIMHPRDDGHLAGLQDGQGQPMRIPPVLVDVPFLPTTSVPINGGGGANEGSILTGYFPDLWIGMRTELRIEILKERFADTLQVGFLAHLRMDVHTAHDESFAMVTGVQP